MQAVVADFGTAVAGVSPQSGAVTMAAATAAEPLPATVSLQQLEQLLQDVWGAEREAKNKVMLLLHRGEERLRDMQLSLQQQQHQSRQVCRHVQQLQEDLLGACLTKKPLAVRLQQREQQRMLLREQLRCAQEVEACLLQIQAVQQELASCRELVRKQEHAAAAAALRRCALKQLLPLMTSARGRQQPAVVAELHQQFAKVYRHLVDALDLQLQQHLKVFPQKIVVTPLSYKDKSGTSACFSISSNTKEAHNGYGDVAVPAMTTWYETPASEVLTGVPETAEGKVGNSGASKPGIAEHGCLRLRDVWEAFDCLGQLRRRLYTLTQSISTTTLQPLFAVAAVASSSSNNNEQLIFVSEKSTADRGGGSAEASWGWTAGRKEGPAAAGGAARTDIAAAAAAAITPQGMLLVVQSLLQFLLRYIGDGHHTCLRTWGPLLQQQLQQPLQQVLLQQPAKKPWLQIKPEVATTTAAVTSAVAFLAAAATAAGIVQTDLFLLQQGLLQQEEVLLLPQQQWSEATRLVLHWLSEEDRRRQIELLGTARQLLQQIAAAEASPVAASEQEVVLATEEVVHGGLGDLLLPQGLSAQQEQHPQQQKFHRLLLPQCIAEEADVSLVQLAPLRITRQTWLLLQLLQSLLRAAAAAAATCTCSSSSTVGGCGVSAVPCWCSNRRELSRCCCFSSSCCGSRISLRAEVAAIISIADLFLLLRPLGPSLVPQAAMSATAASAAAASTADSPIEAVAAFVAAGQQHMRALALRWTDIEVLSRWMMRLPVLLSAAATAASTGSYENCSCSSGSRSRCCTCPSAAARRAFTVWGDALLLFDSRAAPAATSLGAVAGQNEQHQGTAPFRQQLTEIVVALKRQQEESYVCLVSVLQQGLQQAAKELSQTLTAAGNSSSSSVEIHLEAAAGDLTKRLHSAALDLLPILPLQVRSKP